MDSVKKGMYVWYRGGGKKDEVPFRRGRVVSVEGDAATVAVEDDEHAVVHEVEVAHVFPVNPSMLEKVDDLTELTFLHEPGILQVLKERFDESVLYTHAGPVLVALNPFKQVDLYSKEYVDRYVSRPAMGQASYGKEYKPHIFLTADKAFKEMKVKGVSQSILITGESGAGKTETTKFVMKYVAGLAGGSGMEHRVLETNPILEAFGNAKTLHNNNSSRFGKLIDIHFDDLYRICGASIETYLLEKSRVVHQLAGERNYHIFYQLLEGATTEMRDTCLIPDQGVEAFTYLKTSGCCRIEHVNDAENFGIVCDAMTDIGISKEEQMGFWKVLMCILWLGNVEFEKLSDDAVKVRDGPAIENAAALMGVTKASLVDAISKRKMFVGGEVITKELNIEAAQDVRDALVKFLYEAQFRDLIHKVNAALKDAHGSSLEMTTTLSLLDIYGFECFDDNSFEQLCINYANERLQQQFAHHLFKLEQKMYEEEGVDWQYVEFEDNQACVDLIESKPPAGLGIMTLLDEECLFPKGSDASFCEKVCKTHAGHERFMFNPNKPEDAFTISHYAGPVTYSSNHFLDKNRDTLNPDIMNLVQGSDSKFIASLSGHMGVASRGRSASVGSRFREQLKLLLERLNKSQLHFVRCIKPNKLQKPLSFDDELVLHQLKCCGVLEVARIARAGYPTRYEHKEFAERYKEFLPQDTKNGLAPLEICTALLEHFRVDPASYLVGKRKLFFRAGVLGHLEDQVMKATESCLTLQSVFRMRLCREPFLRKREAAVSIQSSWRAYQAQVAFEELMRKTMAARQLQASCRTYLARQKYLSMVSATVSLQRWWRRVCLQVKIDETIASFEERQRERAVLEKQADSADTIENQDEKSLALLEAEFQMDAKQIRSVLERYVSGDLVDPRQQQASADPDMALQELQRINVELQKEVDDLKDENALLVNEQARQMSAKKGSKVVAITADTFEADGTSPKSEDSVSIMSYSDVDDGSLPLSSARREISFGRAGPQGAVAALNAEMSKKGHIFSDDAAFIREVHEGISMAPNMDPDFEIKRLVVRYKTWNRDFKARLKATQNSLRKNNVSSSPRASPYYSSSAKPVGDPISVKSKKSEGISSKLKSLTRVARGSK